MKNKQLKEDLLLTIYEGGQQAILAAKQLVQLELRETENKLLDEIFQKEDIIIDLITKMDTIEKRKRIPQIIKGEGGNFKERYDRLYSAFGKKYYINVEKKLNRTKENGVIDKSANQMDYICDYMNKTRDLYEIACELFPDTVEKLKVNWED